MIEFFSGSGNMAKAFAAKDYKTLTIDNNPNLKSDMVADMMKLKILDLPEEFQNPNVIHFGVPCTRFSVAGRSSNFTNFMPNSFDSCIALALVYKCLDLISELKPDSWFIENPMGYLRKFPMMEKLVRKEPWYCQYGDTKAKPTDFWTNRFEWIPKKCKNDNPNCNHERAPRGSKTGTQGLNNAYDRGTYPMGLCKEIVDICEGNLSVIQTSLVNPSQKVKE